MYRLLEQERQKLEVEKQAHAETKRLMGIMEKENTDLKAQIAKGVKKSIPSHIRAEVRSRYKLIKDTEKIELDLHVSIDHPDNKAILDRVVTGAVRSSKYKVTEPEAIQASRDMFINLRDDNSRVINGKKTGHLKTVRRRNRMSHKMDTRKAALDSEHCELSAQEKNMASVMFTKRVEYISSEDDENVEQVTESGKRTVRHVRILPFESQDFKRIKLSLDETHRNHLTPEWRREKLIVLVKDPSVCEMSGRKVPPRAPHWAVDVN